MQYKVKSFVLRNGRISNRQQHGLDYLDDYALPLSPWELSQIFGRNAETVVEIGFGMGASLFRTAKERPELNFIGIEVHRAGIGGLAAALKEQGLTNVRIAPFDAVEVFKGCVPDASLEGIQIFFPDPWPKKRHHKRRLIQADFVQLISQKLKPGGCIHCATDWEAYALQMMQVLSEERLLKNQQKHQDFSPRPNTRPLTKFEVRGTKLGHSVWDLIFVRADG